jgi:hypothetical protein
LDELARGGATAALQAEVLEYKQIIEHIEKICEVLRMDAGLVAIKRGDGQDEAGGQGAS